MSGQPSFLSLAFTAPVPQRALKIALIVGTLLVLINHGGALVEARMDLTRWLQVLLTYCVPYCVSTYSSVAALRSAETE